MAKSVQRVGLAVSLFLALGCSAAPRQNIEVRRGLFNPHIIMGKDVTIEEAPYQISIEVLRFHICGGAIISETHAITAAHCINPGVTGFTWLTRIRAGSTTVFPFFGWGGKIHHIQEIHRHPEFTVKAIDYDVGVIKVSNKFVYGTRIQPIIIPPAGESFLDFNRNATVSGWGLTNRGGLLPAFYLKSVEIPLMARTRCSDLYEGVPNETLTITPRMLCGAGTGLGSPCKGDTGGPMVHRGKVIGLVSWSFGCNDPTFPSVFTNLLNEEIRGFVKEYSGI